MLSSAGGIASVAGDMGFRNNGKTFFEPFNGSKGSILNPSKGQKVGATEVLRDHDTEQCLWNVGIYADSGSPRWVKATNWMTTWEGGVREAWVTSRLTLFGHPTWGFLRIYSEQQGEDEWAKKGK